MSSEDEVYVDDPNVALASSPASLASSTTKRPGDQETQEHKVGLVLDRFCGSIHCHKVNIGTGILSYLGGAWETRHPCWPESDEAVKLAVIGARTRKNQERRKSRSGAR
jgi:hypothetical protein